MNFADYQLSLSDLSSAHKARCAAFSAESQRILATLAAQHQTRCAAFNSQSLHTFNAERTALEARYRLDKEARQYLKSYIEHRKRYPTPGTLLNTVQPNELDAIGLMCEIDPGFTLDRTLRHVYVTPNVAK